MRWVVPFPPGGGVDVVARLIAQRLSETQPRTEFSGGEQTNARLRALGFDVVRKGTTVGPEEPSALRPGDVLTNDQLSRVLGVGNAGGMRWSSGQGCLVIVADHTKGLYDDRWEGDVLHYTSMGRIGDQYLYGQNKRLADQAKTGVPVHLFEVFRPGAYTYVGRVRLAGEPRRERQLDDAGDERWAFVFPLAFADGAERPTPDRRDLERIQAERRRALSRASDAELVKLAKLGGAGEAQRPRVHRGAVRHEPRRRGAGEAAGAGQVRPVPGARPILGRRCALPRVPLRRTPREGRPGHDRERRRALPELPSQDARARPASRSQAAAVADRDQDLAVGRGLMHGD
mgnify:CR=1 FL=1